MTEESLIAAAQRGNREALQRLLVPLQRPVYRYLCQFLRPQDAADVAQETFIRVVRKINTYTRPFRFRAWVLRIAYRQMINHCRAESRHEKQKPLQPENPVAPESANPFALAVGQEQTEKFRQILTELSEPQRQVVWLRLYEDFTFREIAEICELPLNTVLSRMHQAKQKLVRLCEAAGITGPDR